MRLLLCTFIILTTCFSVCIAATHYIKPDGTGDFTTIQAGINAAGNGDIVLLAAGTYTGPGNKSMNFHGKAITVTSESGPDVTIIDCENLGRGFFFNSGEGPASVVSGLTIQNGKPSGHPSFGYGGAIYCGGSSPTITNNTISGNTSIDDGGGIYCFGSSSPAITNNTITGNTGKVGGGICCDGSSPTITNNTITDNASIYTGGGIYCYGSLPTITNNTITGNTGKVGGGIYCYGSSPTITNNTISGNTAANYGGGIYCAESSAPTITNNTITGNSAELDGGGIFCNTSSSPTIENTIISFNTQGRGVYCLSSNPTFICCDIYGNSGGDALCGTDGGNNISVDPLFCGQVIGNYQLAENSPCAPGNSPCGVLVGAWPVACGGVPVDETTWGRIKSMYRD